MKRFHRRLLALALPRSGSRFLTECLQVSGVKVGQEALNSDGTVGMFFAVEDCWYPGKHWVTEDEQRQHRSDFEFDQVWHFTRDPRKAIASIALHFFAPTIWCWQEQHTGIPADLFPKKLRAMQFWVAWNELIEKNEKIDLFFRIEDIDAVWPEICERLAIGNAPAVPPVPRNYGTVGTGQRMPWSEMESIDSVTYLRVREMAERYGYSTR